MWESLLHLALTVAMVAGEPRKLLVFVPGLSFKNEKAVRMLNSNLRTIRSSIHVGSVSLKCNIAVFDHVLPGEGSVEGELSGCDLSLLQEGRFADHIKMVPPAMLKYGSIDWVFLLLDDVQLDEKNFKYVLHFERNMSVYRC